MPRISWNIFANLLGAASAMVVTLVCIPPTIRVLGMEAYGLIGFCMLLQTILAALQLGSPDILLRELSILRSDQQHASSDLRAFVSTLEVISWGSALLIAAASAVTLPWLASTWLKSSIEPQVLTPAMILLGVMVALQWPVSLYHAGLAGLERADQANVILFLATVSRHFGGLAVLWFWTPDLAHYAGWQACSMALYALMLRRTLLGLLPVGVSRFSLQTLRRHRDYAVGVTANAIVGLVLSQLDRVVLINFLSLEEFGFYVLAATLTSVLPRLSSPLTAAATPRLARLATEGDTAALADLYHKASQVLAVLLVPAALVVMVFAPEILWVWTGNVETVSRTAPLVRVLFVAALLTGLMSLPCSTQMAHRWTSLSFKLNLASLVFCTPLQIAGAVHFGPLGVALANVVNSIACLVIGNRLMHRRILPGELRRWYLVDIGRPFTAALFVAGLVRCIAPLPTGRLELMACLTLTGVVMLSAAAAFTSLPYWLRSRVRGAMRGPKFAGMEQHGKRGDGANAPKLVERV